MLSSFLPVRHLSESARTGGIEHRRNRACSYQFHALADGCYHFCGTRPTAIFIDLLENHLKPAINSRWRGLLPSRVPLQHANVRPRTAPATSEKVTKLRFAVPSASSLFSRPRTYCLPYDGTLRHALSCNKFSARDEAKESVHTLLRSQSKNAFLPGPRHW